MKIKQIEFIPFSIPFTNTFVTSNQTHTHRNGIWIQINTEEDIGLGESAPLPKFSTESLKDIHYVLEGFYQSINNEDLEEEELISLINIHTSNTPSVRFGLETALYDILAKNKNIPLSKYLNPNCLTKIKVNGIAGIHFPNDGFSIIKTKVGFRNLFDEIENMEYLSESFGSKVKFRLDVNGSFDLPQAIRFCKEMEKFNIDYIEQPLNPKNLEDLAELMYHTKIPIAVDESLTNYQSAEEIIEMQAAQIFIIKPMVTGGFTETQKIINLAKNENIKVIVTSSLEAAIGRMACLHIAAINNINEECGIATGELLIENKNPDKISNGTIQIPNLPGLGIEKL